MYKNKKLRNIIIKNLNMKQKEINMRNVRDRNHISGYYRGAAHFYCNIYI